MKTYVVTLKETVRYFLEIEADSADEANEAANEKWCRSRNPQNDFPCEGDGVEISLTLEKR